MSIGRKDASRARRCGLPLSPLSSATSGDFVRLKSRHGDDKRSQTRSSSNFLKQPFFLPVSTIRSEGFRWMVARGTVNLAQSAGDARRLVELSPRLSLSRQNSVSRAYGENRRCPRGGFPFSKPPPSASRPSCASSTCSRRDVPPRRSRRRHVRRRAVLRLSTEARSVDRERSRPRLAARRRVDHHDDR
jgi:hypothetical protein